MIFSQEWKFTRQVNNSAAMDSNPFSTQSRLFIHKKLRRRPGIALVLTLVVLLLLTIFMTEFHFETTLEIRAIENFQSSFVAQSVVKSMFKAVLVALSFNESIFFEQLANLYQFTGADAGYSFLDPPSELIPLPQGIFSVSTDHDFKEAIFYTPYVRPIDHLFNLNRIQTKKGTRAPDSPTDRIIFNLFVNLVTQIPIDIPRAEGATEPLGYYYLELEEIAPLYAAVFDWTDAKDNGTPYSNEAGVQGVEDLAYLNFEAAPDLKIKNRGFDRLSELKLIEGIVESEIPFEDWKRHFTVHEVGIAQGLEVEPRLNVNLASRDEIDLFLRRFEQNTQYYAELGGPPENQAHLQEFAEYSQEIAAALVIYDNTGKRVRFPDFRSINEVLRPLDLTQHNYQDFFILHSNWYEIRLVAEAIGIQAEIQAVVYTPRNQNGDANGRVVIKDFLLR